MTRLLDPLTFPLNGMRMIEASAGTGKTYTIAALYLRLVTGHGGENAFSRPLAPPEILVVTFTNAATEELRNRIGRRLMEASSFLRSDSNGDDYLKRLRETIPRDRLLGEAQALEQAAQWMDEAAIYTIHGWCKRMLRQHAFASGSLFDLELSTSHQDLLEEAACDFWRDRLYIASPQITSLILSLIKCDTPQALLKRVAPLLDSQLEAVEDPFVLAEKRLMAIEKTRQIWAADFDQAVGQIRKAQTEKTLKGNYYRKDHLEKWLNQLSAWVNTDGELPAPEVLAKFSAAGLKNGVAKDKMPPQHPAYNACDQLIRVLTQNDIEYAFLVNAATDIVRRFKNEKERLAQMDFNDLLLRLDEALQNPGNQRLAEIIRRQYPVALIDEFQDTDPIQYRIFKKIYFEQADTGLFMIGDPKQAIYSFRNADLHVYLQARRQTKGQPYTLNKNFRSSEGIVSAVNQLFTTASDYPDGAFLFKDQIPYTAVECQNLEQTLSIDGQDTKSLTFWHSDQTQPLTKSGDQGYEKQMAQATANAIVEMLNLAAKSPPKAGFRNTSGRIRALRASDVAILVRSGHEAQRIRRELNLRGVRSVYLSDRESVFTSETAKSLFYLLYACAHPQSERSLKAALATNLLDLSFYQLEQLNQNEPLWEIEIERFRHYNRIWQQRGVLPMLRKVFHEFNVLHRLLSAPNGERQLTDLLHLSELLQAEAYRLDGEKALIRWFAEQLDKEEDNLDAQIVRLESDAELVKVVTIHKSKGLEYPLVFLPFVCSAREVTSRDIVKLHDTGGNLKTVLYPTEAERERADQERLAEDLRLLYVALTRARYACWLGMGTIGTKSKKAESNSLHKSAIGYLLSAGHPIETAKLSDCLRKIKGGCPHIDISQLPSGNPAMYSPKDQAETITPALDFKATIPRDWAITSYSGILSGAQMPEYEEAYLKPSRLDSQIEELQAFDSMAEPDQTATEVSIHSFPRGPNPGTFLHNLLEWAANKGFAEIARDRSQIQTQLNRLCQRRGWHDWVNILTDWFISVLTTPIVPDTALNRTCLSDLHADLYQAEMEFFFETHHVPAARLDQLISDAVLPGYIRPKLKQDQLNGMFKGFIDLVFCHQESYYVLDYKSNYLGANATDYNHESLATAMIAHRYDLQYVIYIFALHRLLKARLPHYNYNKHIGGAIYLFLRGVNNANRGIYADKPPQTLIDRLDLYFQGKE